MGVSGIEEAIDDIRRGRMVILVDDEDRENEGDLVVAAEKVTPEIIHFMADKGRGLICLTMAEEHMARLALEPMATDNRAPLGTAFTNSIDAADLNESGVTAQARAHTIQTAIREDTTSDDLVSPGYVFPLRARNGGVLVRAGQTEGSVDLARLAGLKPAGVICEIMNPDGTMSRLPNLLEFGEEHGMRVVTVASLIEYRLQKESFVQCVAQARLPTGYGQFDILAYKSELDETTHIVLRHGQVGRERPALVRVHRADLLSDVFGLELTRSRHKLDLAMKRIVDEGGGVLLYLRGDVQSDHLAEDLRRYCGNRAPGAKEDSASASPTMDFRDFGIGAQILAHLGIEQLRVLTNSPLRFRGLGGFGLQIVESVNLE